MGHKAADTWYFITLVVWTVISIAGALFCGFTGLAVLAFGMWEQHMDDFREFIAVPMTVILLDIAIWCVPALLAELLIAWAGFRLTTELLEDMPAGFNYRHTRGYLYGLAAFNTLLLCAGPVVAAVIHWTERAPYFARSS